METVKLIRFDKSDQGVFGKIVHSGLSWFTGELPDRENRNSVSCIPTGRYIVKWTRSPRLKRYTYEVMNVPGRGGIRIHPSNLMGDSKLGYIAQLLGCISLGFKLGYINKQKALLVSRPAVHSFEDVMQRKTFILEIAEDA